MPETNEFKIKFRGVRGSYPCANKKFMQYDSLWKRFDNGDKREFM